MARITVRKFLAVAAMLLTFADAGAAFAMPIAPIADSSAVSATLVRGGRGGGGRGMARGGAYRGGRGGAVAMRGGRGGAVAVRGGAVRGGAYRGGVRGGAVVRGGGYRRGGAVVWGASRLSLGAGRRDRGGRGYWFHHGGRRCGLLHQPAAGSGPVLVLHRSLTPGRLLGQLPLSLSGLPATENPRFV